MGKSEAAVLDIPVEFGGVSIGDATARLGIKIDRSVCNILTADETFCGHRLSGRVVLGSGNDSPGQETFFDTDDVVEGVFDVKRFGANGKQISTSLTFSLADVDIQELAKFSKGSGRLVIDNVGELPEGSDDDDEDAEGQQELAGTLRAEGPWRNFSLDELFHGAIRKSLKKAGLNTVGELADYTASDRRLTDLDDIGPAKAEQIENRMLQFWKDNPNADQAAPAVEAAAPAEPAVELNGTNWRTAPLSDLGLNEGLIERFEELNVTTVGGLVELREAVAQSRAVWPKGIGPAKVADIEARLEKFRDKHAEPAAV